MKKAHNHHPGKILPIIQLAARMIKDNPHLLDDIDEPQMSDRLRQLRAQLKVSIPELADPSTCPNCGASMAEYIDRLDINVALLLLNMGRLVAGRSKSMEFTEANRIRVSAEPSISHTQKCHTTRSSKLGLIAKAGNAHWSITKRGFEALRGMPVPATRVTFRGQILERPEETTTLAAVFSGYKAKMDEQQRKKKSMRHDHRGEFDTYDPRDYYEIKGMHQGELL